MELTLFPASKGDCLLLRSSRGTSILIDGGMKASFRDEVAPHLGSLVSDLDLVCVSHIDNDHVNGIVAMFEMLEHGAGSLGIAPGSVDS